MNVAGHQYVSLSGTTLVMIQLSHSKQKNAIYRMRGFLSDQWERSMKTCQKI